jgi:HNH endonuclease
VNCDTTTDGRRRLGLCPDCYRAFLALGDRARIVVRGIPGRRFMAKIDMDGPIPEDVALGPCWLWIGSVTEKGYGLFRAGPEGTVLAHRWIWEHCNGEIPPDYQVDHVCHDWAACALADFDCIHRLCVNPEHLQCVTPAANNARSGSPSAVNARKTHCDQGHEFTQANTYIHPKRGTRHCVACQVDRSREHERARRDLVMGAAAKRRAARAPGKWDVPMFEVVRDPK